MITLRPVSDAHCADILRIKTASRPAVAALERPELDRLLALGKGHLVAVAGDATVVAHMLVFAHSCDYDGEEFQYFRAQLQQPFLYVDQLAVEPGRQRSGIGTLLYAALQERARKNRIEWLCCEVNSSPANPASLKFHRHLGFTAMGNGDTLDGLRVTYLVRKV